jgi:NTP pyrophosphatase (non-canonical NTP hydrolase)
MLKDFNSTIEELWEEQKQYNQKIRQTESRSDEEWILHYVVGCQEELFELLREVDWKFHRSRRFREHSSIPWELADITKYVMCLWQTFGIELEQALQWVKWKSSYLEQLYYQEHPHELKENVIIVDLDGVVANFRKGFLTWCQTKGISLNLLRKNIHLDIAAGWNTPEYESFKLEFELKTEGYLSLPAYNHVIEAINSLEQTSVIVHTARPRNSKVISDTWRWLQQNNLKLDELYIGSSNGRLVQAQALLSQGYKVLLLEDDPTLLERARSIKGLKILKSKQPYNEDNNSFEFFDPEEPASEIRQKFLEQLRM